MRIQPSDEFIDTGTFSSGGGSGLVKNSKVFRPGATTEGIRKLEAPAGSPYGPMQAKVTMQGAVVNALYNATDEEVGRILAGVDGTGDGTPLSPVFRRGLKDIMLAAGFLSKKDYIPSAEFGSADYAAMRDLLKEANYLGGYNWREAVGLISDQIAAKGTGARTSTYTQYNLTNEDDAEIVVNAALNNFLGRGATKEEKATLSRALRKYEQQAPTVTTTTAGDGSTVSTTTSGASAAGRQEALLGALSDTQRREMSGVVNTQLGERFSEMLRNA